MDFSLHKGPTTDAALLEMIGNAKSKEIGFRHLVDIHKDRLYRHIRRMVIEHDDADDVLQETFIKAWRYIDKFRADSSLYTWLYKISTNCCLTHIAKKQKELQSKSNVDVANLSSSVRAQSNFDSNKLEWQMQLAIQSLPEKQRVVFNLRYFDEMPYQQMSEVLETSVGALKASYHIAAKKIETFIMSQH